MVDGNGNEPIGYRVGDMHPTVRKVNDKTRQEEPGIPAPGRYTGFKAMVSGGISGRQGVCDGVADDPCEEEAKGR